MCNCGCNCQAGCGCYLVNLPENPTQALTFENVNVTGIGVLDSVTGSNVEFRGVVSSSGALVVTLDAGNNTIVLTVDIPGIVDEIPTATTTVRGIGETATDAEAILKAAVDKFLTPSNLAALGSSTTFAGLTEYATGAETLAMASNVLAVTPLGLASLITTLEQTTTWADAVARVAAVPAFAGQIGVQLDSDIPYISTSAIAGGFDRPLFTFGSTNTISGLTTSVTTDGTTVLTFTGGGEIHFNGPNVLYSGGLTEYGASSNQLVNFADITLQIGGATVPAASVLTTGGLGDPSSALISAFISTFDTQTGYTNFTNSATLRTGDCNALTLPQICQIVDTLIRDLKAVQLPAT